MPRQTHRDKAATPPVWAEAINFLFGLGMCWLALTVFAADATIWTRILRYVGMGGGLFIAATSVFLIGKKAIRSRSKT
ncbi:MAG: hypothetical protein PSX79_02685 [bacterium]|nr:hypothetical protein [bacterium]